MAKTFYVPNKTGSSFLTGKPVKVYAPNKVGNTFQTAKAVKMYAPDNNLTKLFWGGSGWQTIDLSNTDMSDYVMADESQYYLTSKCLWNKLQANAETWYTEDGYFRKYATRKNNTSTQWWIPINRVYNPKKLKVQTKWLVNTGSYDFWNFGVGYVDSNNALQNRMANNSWYSDHYSDWTEVEFDFTSANLPYIDYLVLGGLDGSPAFKPTIKVYVEE